ncbi:hypothetical protein, unlikely [Trypanosoma brucei gambiense DAL972]|uniref:T. brucei spp.-specific protein n=1 Tax=Trypanosoma brucei gambiense (strain MHOM/CI/86/DAL972) TaxID=679716 RepID=C9ZWR2_TRYB9|nr:hypothetical protein, unlikely [Trypanosoma brucei gambiense DAL972]CBH13851.1 hypothetical protein, unlikely [Trypanosoma brucei gambiense DAL972]|eukprot:XP_011776127.1 hypothetical protein, unlikely [Trypanosoma brucei gambiense DAL972]
MGGVKFAVLALLVFALLYVVTRVLLTRHRSNPRNDGRQQHTEPSWDITNRANIPVVQPMESAPPLSEPGVLLAIPLAWHREIPLSSRPSGSDTGNRPVNPLERAPDGPEVVYSHAKYIPRASSAS